MLPRRAATLYDMRKEQSSGEEDEGSDASVPGFGSIIVRRCRHTRRVDKETTRKSLPVSNIGPIFYITAPSVAHASVTHWVMYYGSKIRLLSENEKDFNVNIFQDVCRLLGNENVFTTQ